VIEQQDIFLPQFQIYDYRNPLHISSINMLFMYMSQHEFAPWRGKDLEIDLSLKPKDFEAPVYNSEYLEYDRSILGYNYSSKTELRLHNGLIQKVPMESPIKVVELTKENGDTIKLDNLSPINQRIIRDILAKEGSKDISYLDPNNQRKIWDILANLDSVNQNKIGYILSNLDTINQRKIRDFLSNLNPNNHSKIRDFLAKEGIRDNIKNAYSELKNPINNLPRTEQAESFMANKYGTSNISSQRNTPENNLHILEEVKKLPNRFNTSNSSNEYS